MLQNAMVQQIYLILNYEKFYLSGKHLRNNGKFLLGKLLDEGVEPLVLFCIFSLASPNTIYITLEVRCDKSYSLLFHSIVKAYSEQAIGQNSPNKNWRHILNLDFLSS